jgi:hypothetical protein
MSAPLSSSPYAAQGGSKSQFVTAGAYTDGAGGCKKRAIQMVGPWIEVKGGGQALCEMRRAVALGRLGIGHNRHRGSANESCRYRSRRPRCCHR